MFLVLYWDVVQEKEVDIKLEKEEEAAAGEENVQKRTGPQLQPPQTQVPQREAVDRLGSIKRRVLASLTAGWPLTHKVCRKDTSMLPCI